MIALGFALILIAAGATVFAVIASANAPTAIELTAFNVTISATPLALFIAGALVVALIVLGLALISRGTRRTARTHKELKQLRKENAIAATRAAAERDDDVSGDSTDEATEEATDGSATGTRNSADDEPGKSPTTSSDLSSEKGPEEGSHDSTSRDSASRESGDTNTDGTGAQTAPGR